MSTRFTESQSVEILLSEERIPIQHYLRQPRRLVNALMDPSRIEVLGEDCFRLKMRPLNFMMLQVQPVVDLRIWSDSNGVLHLRSAGCEIRGVEYINQRFDLDLVGQLAVLPVVTPPPNRTQPGIQLWGEVDLEIRIELPPALWLTPKSLIDATGKGMLRGILATMKQRLMHQLVADYRQWVADQEPAVTNPRAASLSSGQSLA